MMLTSALLSLAFAVPAQEPASWTVLVYGASDNDSEESFCPDMRNLMESLQTTDVNVLAFVDRSPLHSDNPHAFGEDFADSRLYRLLPEGPVRLAGGDAFPEITTDSEYEANSGDAETLGKALRWAKASAPAERYALLFYSHGSGKSWCPDETDGGDMLYSAELTDVLEERDSVDLIVFDVCSMAGVENAYQWRPRMGRFSAKVVVATPMAGFPFPWESVFARIREGEAPDGAPAWIAPSELTPQRFGALVVEETERHRRAELASGDVPERFVPVVEGEAMTCLDLTRAEDVKKAVDGLAVALSEHAGGQELLEGTRGPSEEPLAMHYMVDGERGWLTMPYIDLYDLATRLAGNEEAPVDVRESAGAVARATDGLVIASYGLAKYDRYGGFQAGKNGVYVVFPDGDEPDELTGRRWARFRWYHPEERNEARSYGRYEWCSDGAVEGNGRVENWFELLDAWFDEGDGNGYAY